LYTAEAYRHWAGNDHAYTVHVFENQPVADAYHPIQSHGETNQNFATSDRESGVR
jgi:hypothetical protein